jgi:nicotinamidase-related amidase
MIKKTAAFILLDPQCDFFESANPNWKGFEKTIPVINRTLDYFRQHHLPVIIIQHTSVKLPAHTPRWAIYPKIQLHASDLILRKHYQNAFWKSRLGSILHKERVSHIVIAGYMAEYCVLSTYRGAIERGFKPVLLADGVAGVHHPEVVLDWSLQVSSRRLFSKGVENLKEIFIK